MTKKHPFFYIFGIGNSVVNFTDFQKKIIARSKIFSGGKRHHTIVKEYLPKNHQWIDIKTPLENVFQRYEKKETVVVFASGDPLFFGFANTLKRVFHRATFKIIGYKNSAQLLCEHLNIATNDIENISLHGRNSWKPLEIALMNNTEKIAILTDNHYTPQKIATKLLSGGYENYLIHIGENMENDREKISSFDLKTAQKSNFAPLNIVLLTKTKNRKKCFGIPDAHFVGLENRPNMITKTPIRLATLHFLKVQEIKTLWDIGFCTGSVSIEAQLQNPSLHITAFEKNEICENLIKTNAKKMGALGIEILMGDFFTQHLERLKKPDAVFIGGHSGKLTEMLPLINKHIATGGRIVCNAILPSTIENFLKICNEMQYEILPALKIKIDTHNTISILCAIKIRPLQNAQHR